MDRFEFILGHLRTHGGLPGIDPRITEVFVATAEQVEANRLAILKLEREIRLAKMPEWQRLLHEMADHQGRKLPSLTQDESGQAPDR